MNNVGMAMSKRNLTIQLDDEVVRKAKVLAARRSTSISRLISDEIERLVRKDDAYEAARIRALERMQRGYHLGGPPYAHREELYDRN